MELGFLLTQRCNAQCTHCATDCGPHQNRTLPLQKVLALMDEAAQLTSAGERVDFSLSGGEVFLDLEQLVKIIRHGVNLKGSMGCVTNAFWASSDQRSQTIIARMREAGLTCLAVSTSRYHQRFVRLERVRRAVVAARAAGLTTVLKIAFSLRDKDEGLVDQWAEFVGADKLQAFPVLPYVRQGADLPQAHYVRAPGLPEGRCPSPSLTVREDGAAFTCCTPGAFEPLLQVGNVFDCSLEEIVERYHFDPVLQVLRERGPIHFARYAIAHGKGARLRRSYAGECDLCAHIASAPALTSCARASAREFRKHWAERLVAAMRVTAAPDNNRGDQQP